MRYRVFCYLAGDRGVFLTHTDNDGALGPPKVMAAWILKAVFGVLIGIIGIVVAIGLIWP